MTMANDDVTKGQNDSTEPAPAEQTAFVPAPPPPADAEPGAAPVAIDPFADESRSEQVAGEPTYAPAAYTPAAYAAPGADPVYAATAAYDPQPLQGQQDTSRNWMGIVALISGIIGFVIGGIVFGILGLSAVKNGKANNRGMSIWGIVLSIIWVVIGVGAIIALAVFASTVENSAAHAKVGDCYVSTVSSEELTYVNPDFGECTADTTAEVYFVTTFEGASTPDDPTFTDELWNQCTADTATENVDADLAADYYVEYYVPYADTWDTDPHTIVCALSTDGGPVDPAAIDE